MWLININDKISTAANVSKIYGDAIYLFGYSYCTHNITF